MQLKTPTGRTDPPPTAPPANCGIAPISRRGLLVTTGKLAAAALLFGSCLRAAPAQHRSGGSFWSDGTDWIE